jgi:hypothetical protein
MKTLLLILSIATLASCSTAYKSGQTPDDVYYAKSKVIVDEDNRYEKHVDNYDDRQIRMAIHDSRWRTLDNNYDYNCQYSPYNYGYNYGYYYNPYYYPYPVYAGGVKYINPKNTTIRKANLGTYNNTVTTYAPTKAAGTVKTYTTRRYNNTNTQNNNSEPRSYETRTYNPPAQNNSSNTNSSSTPAPSTGTSVARPSRGGSN